MSTAFLEGPQVGTPTDRIDTCTDTSEEATVLAKNVFAAFYRNCVESTSPDDERDNKEQTHTCISNNSSMEFNSGETPLQSGLQQGSLDCIQTENSMKAVSFENLVRDSNVSFTPTVNNSYIMNFVNAIDDADANFNVGSLKQDEFNSGQNPIENLGNMGADPSIHKENDTQIHLSKLELLLQENNDFAIQTNTRESILPCIGHVRSGTYPERATHLRTRMELTKFACLSSHEGKSPTNAFSVRKSSRDRRRAVARRRTLLKRKAEETARGQRLVQALLQLPEHERQKELMNIEQQQREVELRRKAEEKRLLGRQAVERSRGKAGINRKALEVQFMTMKKENQKLKRVLVYLVKSGVLGVEEVQMHRIRINAKRANDGSSAGKEEDVSHLVSIVNEE